MHYIKKIINKIFYTGKNIDSNIKTRTLYMSKIKNIITLIKIGITYIENLIVLTMKTTENKIS